MRDTNAVLLTTCLSRILETRESPPLCIHYRTHYTHTTTLGCSYRWRFTSTKECPSHVEDTLHV
jgi:hypothetical protein